MTERDAQIVEAKNVIIRISARIQESVPVKFRLIL